MVSQGKLWKLDVKGSSCGTSEKYIKYYLSQYFTPGIINFPLHAPALVTLLPRILTMQQQFPHYHMPLSFPVSHPLEVSEW